MVVLIDSVLALVYSSTFLMLFLPALEFINAMFFVFLLESRVHCCRETHLPHMPWKPSNPMWCLLHILDQFRSSCFQMVCNIHDQCALLVVLYVLCRHSCDLYPCCGIDWSCKVIFKVYCAKAVSLWNSYFSVDFFTYLFCQLCLSVLHRVNHMSSL